MLFKKKLCQYVFLLINLLKNIILTQDNKVQNIKRINNENKMFHKNNELVFLKILVSIYVHMYLNIIVSGYKNVVVTVLK